MQKSIFTVMMCFAVSIFLAGVSNTAVAACTSPSGPDGALNQSGGDWFKCDGSSWVPFEGAGGGSGGTGCTGGYEHMEIVEIKLSGDECNPRTNIDQCIDGTIVTHSSGSYNAC